MIAMTKSDVHVFQFYETDSKYTNFHDKFIILNEVFLTYVVCHIR